MEVSLMSSAAQAQARTGAQTCKAQACKAATSMQSKIHRELVHSTEKLCRPSSSNKPILRTTISTLRNHLKMIVEDDDDNFSSNNMGFIITTTTITNG